MLLGFLNPFKLWCFNLPVLTVQSINGKDTGVKCLMGVWVSVWERETKMLSSGLRSGTKASWVTNNTIENWNVLLIETSPSSSVQLWLLFACQEISTELQCIVNVVDCQVENKGKHWITLTQLSCSPFLLSLLYCWLAWDQSVYNHKTCYRERHGNTAAYWRVGTWF